MKAPKKILGRTLFNRELSWLAFNERVLEEARDSSHPLLERLKFLGIVSSNLDEFFMIRVAGLERRYRRKPHEKELDGLTVEETLYQIREWTLAQKARQAETFRGVLEALKSEGVYLQTQIVPGDPILQFYTQELMSSVKVLEGKTSDIVHQLQSSRIYIFVRLKNRFGILPLPPEIDRLVRVPAPGAATPDHFVLLDRLISSGASIHFDNEPVLESFPFKVIRDADLRIDPETDPEDLADTLEEAIQAREKKAIVRLEVDTPVFSDGALFLANALRLHSRAVYRYDAPLDLKILRRFQELPGYDHLRDKPLNPRPPGAINSVPKLVRTMQQHDVLLHHPYDSFDGVIDLLHAAARDEKVVTIRQTLYRTSQKSPVVEALKEAALQKKSVDVLVELKARGDEANNILMARALEEVGATVLKGFSSIKIHCKLTQIVRKNGHTSSFVHIGTGNYNPSTARIYTDLGLFTTDEAMSRDAAKLFHGLKTGRLPRKFEKFVVAPLDLHERLLGWVTAEAKRARKGDNEAHIVAKVNALVDPKLIHALYAASQAGVKIDLIVRGVCALRPGVPGLSENIRVLSIVDRFLEHSRIYYFHNGGDTRVYLSSADWMPRNFHMRIEVAFPIEDPQLKVHVRHVILETYLSDNVKARELMPDGQWVRRTPKEGEKPIRAQQVFADLAESTYEGTPLWPRFQGG